MSNRCCGGGFTLVWASKPIKDDPPDLIAPFPIRTITCCILPMPVTNPLDGPLVIFLICTK